MSHSRSVWKVPRWRSTWHAPRHWQPIHQAVSALQRGEIDLALAGGVNAVLSPGVSDFMMEAGMLSPSGQGRPFDASADGYVRGEGCGLVVLKRLSEAEANGDRIWGVIKGSAVNQNGASAGLTVPNGPAQERVMQAALEMAGFTGADVDYLEAHAVGSQLADAIEVHAVGSVYGKGREADNPLLMGTVKSNIGHLGSGGGRRRSDKGRARNEAGRDSSTPALHESKPADRVGQAASPCCLRSDRLAARTPTGRRARQ